jgi:hypothetical protein
LFTSGAQKNPEVGPRPSVQVPETGGFVAELLLGCAATSVAVVIGIAKSAEIRIA